MLPVKVICANAGRCFKSYFLCIEAYYKESKLVASGLNYYFTKYTIFATKREGRRESAGSKIRYRIRLLLT